MATSQPQPPSLLSTQKSDSGLNIALHPLVLLTISDYITRYTLRNQTGPLVGALLGQQNGLEITIEHAFEVKMIDGSLDVDWFNARLQQMKDVHKVPPLDFVGYYTLVSPTGPTAHHLSLQNEFSTLCPDLPNLLLGFHPSTALSRSSSGALPISLYEATSISEPSTRAAGGDVEMSDALPASSTGAAGFRELPYGIETGEAERIAIDFVARGSGNAAAVSAPSPKTSANWKSKGKGKGVEKEESNKGKKRASDDRTKELKEKEAEKEVDVNTILSSEDAELIASLTAKANAVRMLQSRIKLIKTYLESLPASTASGLTSSPPTATPMEPSPEILRSIVALLSRLPLIVPASSSAEQETDTGVFDKELLASRNDVHLVSLLSSMTQSIQSARELGRKFAVVEAGRKKVPMIALADHEAAYEEGAKIGGMGEMRSMETSFNA